MPDESTSSSPPAPIVPRLILFDIDGTLVLTGRAGVRALTRACESVLGVRDAIAGIPVAGRTDWRILADATARVGVRFDDTLFASLRTTYLQALGEEIQKPGEGLKGVLPGVRPLVESLSARTDALPGLLTGNFAEGARIKLEHFDLWRYFRVGAYGDDAEDRNRLVPFAIERGAGITGHPFTPNDVVVIGDTPHDITCARTVGARSIGVATGGSTEAELRSTGADAVFADLSDTAAVMSALELSGAEGE